MINYQLITPNIKTYDKYLYSESANECRITEMRKNMHHMCMSYTNELFVVGYTYKGKCFKNNMYFVTDF